MRDFPSVHFTSGTSTTINTDGEILVNDSNPNRRNWGRSSMAEFLGHDELAEPEWQDKLNALETKYDRDISDLMEQVSNLTERLDSYDYYEELPEAA